MKIDQSLVRELALKQTQKEKLERAELEKESTIKLNGQPSADSKLVSISKEASLLEASKKLMQEIEEVDLSRVEYFRNLLAKGDYQIDNQKLAEKIAAIFEGGE